MTIRNPIEWATDQFKLAGWAIGSASRAGIGAERDLEVALPEVHRIGLDDLKEALARGFDDFATYRTDVIFLCIIYPVISLVLARFAFGYGMLPPRFTIRPISRRCHPPVERHVTPAISPVVAVRTLVSVSICPSEYAIAALFPP
jgi:hypothetical protein